MVGRVHNASVEGIANGGLPNSANGGEANAPHVPL